MSAIITTPGFLGKDPETKTVGTTQITNFSLGVSVGFGEKKKSNWYQVSAFGKTGEFVAKYLKKGSHVLVSGNLELDEFTNKEGVKVMLPKITANSVSSLGRSEEKEGQEKEATASAGISASELPF